MNPVCGAGIVPLCIEMVPLLPADIPSVMEIERDSHLEPWTEESFARELKKLHSHILAARVPGRRPTIPGGSTRVDSEHGGWVVGYLVYWRVADEIQILNIAVHKAYRRQGIGRALLCQALRIALESGAESAVLEVRRSNNAARALYESLGFRQVGERPGYYGILKEPAILMELNIRDLFPALA